MELNPYSCVVVADYSCRHYIRKSLEFEHFLGGEGGPVMTYLGRSPITNYGSYCTNEITNISSKKISLALS